jgi:hypothetical protein
LPALEIPKDSIVKAEEFIGGWAKELPRDATLALLIDLDREAGLPDEAAVLRDAIHEFFSQRAQAYRRRLRESLLVGRSSLVIGLVAVASAIALGGFLAALMKGSRIGEIVRESLTIGGWVSMRCLPGLFTTSADGPSSRRPSKIAACTSASRSSPTEADAWTACLRGRRY